MRLLKTFLPSFFLITVSFVSRAQAVHVESDDQKINSENVLWADSTKATEFLKSIFQALQSGNADKYTSLIATKEEFRIIASLSSSRVENFDSLHAVEINRRKTEFQKLLKDAKKEGIQWSETKFVDFVIKRIKPDNYSEFILLANINLESKKDKKNIFGIQAIQINSNFRLLTVEKILPGRLVKFVDLDSFDFR